MPATEHEQATIRAFIVRDKRERFSRFVANPKTRGKFIALLPHFRWFDRRFVVPVRWHVDPGQKLSARRAQGIGDVVDLLRSRGAGETCWAISEEAALDGQEAELQAAVECVSGTGMGTILSCIPGRLAYFEGEDERLLLSLEPSAEFADAALRRQRARR